ncbi:MAG TPA: OsmC family protein [Aestuariivirgaceae bacterium]|jgi:organic hydroperoxide reductase OsmC/OhrA
MASYTASIKWNRNGEVFTDNKYSRGHEWSFDGGVSFRASASPHVVPRFADPNGVDPEEAFVASLSSCHMLTFLSMAAMKQFTVDSYVDEAIGTLAKNAKGKLAMVDVVLRPKVVFSGANLPNPADINQLHDRAHEECFIANSVTTNVRCEPVK